MKIQPCPFCGGKDSSRREASGGGYFRECYHCNAKGPWRADAGEADTVWNHSVTAALTKERDEARRERDCVGENEAFAHEEVEKLTKERDEARGENNMLRLQLAGKACYNCGGAINPQTMHCDECVSRPAARPTRRWNNTRPSSGRTR